MTSRRCAGSSAAIGLSDEPAQAEETAWALRRLLERLARERPLVVAIEDIHWAEPPLLDLLDHLVVLSSGSPILLVCLTRPELLETHPAWAAPQPNRSVLVLDALGRRAGPRAGRGARCRRVAGRIARRAEGNPLFVEQLVAVDSRAGNRRAAGQHPGRAGGAHRPAQGGRAQAAAARRDRGAHVSPRRARPRACPASGPQHRPARLVALARKGLISADRSEFPGEDAFASPTR